MSAKITEHFRQRKTGSDSRAGGAKKQAEAPPLLGAHGAAAVSDSDISAEERLLREFDLDSRFGPCAGLTRLERWARADKFGLNPPAHVRELLQRLPAGDNKLNQCLWDGRV